MENEVTSKEGNVRISISWDGVNDKDIDSMMTMFEGLLYAAGYRMDGHLDVVEE